MNEKVKQFREERKKLNERILSKENNAGILKRIFATDTFSYLESDAGLSARDKELLGLATSMVLRCDDCINYHLERCFELGVSNQEMMDLFGIANLVGGTIVIPHTRRAIAYWEILRDERPDPSPFSEAYKYEKYNTIIQSLDAEFKTIEKKDARFNLMIHIIHEALPYFGSQYVFVKNDHKLTLSNLTGKDVLHHVFDFNDSLPGRIARSRDYMILQPNKENGLEEDIKVLVQKKKAIANSMLILPFVHRNNSLLALYIAVSEHKNAINKTDMQFLTRIAQLYLID